MPEPKGDQSAQRPPRKKKMFRTPKCPKTKRKTDANKSNARQAKGLNGAPKIKQTTNPYPGRRPVPRETG